MEKKGFQQIMAAVNELPLDKILDQAETLLTKLSDNSASEKTMSNKLLGDTDNIEKGTDGNLMQGLLKGVIKLLKLIIASRPVANSLLNTNVTPNALASNDPMSPDEMNVPNCDINKQEKLEMFDKWLEIAIENGELTPDDLNLDNLDSEAHDSFVDMAHNFGLSEDELIHKINAKLSLKE